MLFVFLFLGGFVVVDLINDLGFYDSNVVDLISESLVDFLIDFSFVIVVWIFWVLKWNFLFNIEFFVVVKFIEKYWFG